MDSILITIKKMLGIDESVTHFDTEVMVNINTELMTLNQLGVGPSTGFSISSNEQTWKDFTGERKDLDAIKTYIYLKVKLVFDPPTNAFVVDAMTKRASELEWRINNQAEGGV